MIGRAEGRRSRRLPWRRETRRLRERVAPSSNAVRTVAIASWSRALPLAHSLGGRIQPLALRPGSRKPAVRVHSKRTLSTATMRPNGHAIDRDELLWCRTLREAARGRRRQPLAPRAVLQRVRRGGDRRANWSPARTGRNCRILRRGARGGSAGADSGSIGHAFGKEKATNRSPLAVWTRISTALLPCC